MRQKRIPVTVVAAILTAIFMVGDRLTPAAGADDQATWPEFHGPGRTNISPEKGLLKKWPEAGPPLVWKYAPCG